MKAPFRGSRYIGEGEGWALRILRQRGDEMRTAARRLTGEDIERAEAVWTEYVRSHDISDRTAWTAGIDPESGRIWFGESILDVMAQQDVEGVDAPLLFIRVGSDYYFRKGLPKDEGGRMKDEGG